MRHVLGCFALSCVLIATAQAAMGQPLLDDTPSIRSPGGGETKIPVVAPSTEVLSAENSGSSTTPAPLSLEQPIDPDTYICGAGDVFELNFWGQQNFRLRLAADLEGRAFISKVGFVAVSGKTLSEVRKVVTKKVRRNYPGLNFELALVRPRSFLVHVVDYVKKPGSYTATPLERVSEVLERAGGVTGSRRRIAIHHKNGTETTADLVLYQLTGNTTHNPYLLDGDIVDVPAPGITVTVNGAVRRPGSYELIRTKDLAEALELAGGFTSSVVRTMPIRVVHKNMKQQEAYVDVPFRGESPGVQALDDADSVVVRGADELQRSVLLLGAVLGADPIDAATSGKRLPYIEGDTAMSLIGRAGGLKAPGDLRRSYIARPRPKGPPELIPLDLEALLVKRDFRADKRVQMDDTIVIPPMQYSVRIEGAVARPGFYPYNPLFGVPEYIAHAGGRTRIAKDLDDAKVVDPDGRTRRFSSELKPLPGDAIVIPERNFSRAEVVQLVFAGAGLVLSGIAVTLAATR